MNPEDPDNPDNEAIVTKNVLNVEPNPLYFQRAPGLYQTTPNVLRMTHITTTEQAVHVWKSANSSAENFARVDFTREASFRLVIMVTPTALTTFNV